ncbi:MAG: type VI secretion system protein TssA [Planctomycetota bacterium]
MASPEVIDFAKLLEPIAGDNPSGMDLRTDPTPNSPYYAIKDARNRARADERRLEEDPENAEARPDWKPVLQLAQQALIEKSKDLELSAYLVEALVRAHGLAGLRDGFRLLRELCEKFWDQGLYPLPDEDGVETRVYPLTGLNGADASGTLIGPIQQIKITEGKSDHPFAYFHYKQACDVAGLPPDQQERRIEQGAVSLDKFMAAVSSSSADFYASLKENIEQCVDEFYKLSELLDNRCGSAAPPTSNIRNALQDVREAVDRISKDKLPSGEVHEEATTGEAQAGGSAATSAAATAVAVGSVRNREDAFRVLGQVAEYFRKNEPHSPISFAIDQIVRWGKMPLPLLLSELIPDTTARDQLFKWVGIKPPESSE